MKYFDNTYGTFLVKKEYALVNKKINNCSYDVNLEKIDNLDLFINELHEIFGVDATISLCIVYDKMAFCIGSANKVVYIYNISCEALNILLLEFSISPKLKQIIKLTNTLSDDVRLKVELE